MAGHSGTTAGATCPDTGTNGTHPFRGVPCPVPVSRVPAPIDTPADWHQRIAKRQSEWQTLGSSAAILLWHQRGEASRHVLHAMGVSP